MLMATGALNIHLILAPYFCQKNQSIKHHYFFVDNFNIFAATLYKSHNPKYKGHSQTSSTVSCPHCYLRFSNSVANLHRFYTHTENCDLKTITEIVMPEKGSRDEFVEFRHKGRTARPVVSLFFDAETTHSVVSPMCVNCNYLYTNINTNQGKDEIARR